MVLNVDKRNVAIAVGLPAIIATVNQWLLIRLDMGERLAAWEVIAAWLMLAAQVLATSVVSGRFATGIFRWLTFAWTTTVVVILARLVHFGLHHSLGGMYYVGFHRGVVSGVIVAGMLSSRPWMIRLPILAVVVAVMQFIFLRGFSEVFTEVESTLTVFAICAVLRWQGFRLVARQSEPNRGPAANATRQFTLRQIFILMTSIAVVVAILKSRLGLTNWEVHQAWQITFGDGVLSMVSGVVAVATVWGALGSAAWPRRLVVVSVASQLAAASVAFVLLPYVESVLATGGYYFHSAVLAWSHGRSGTAPWVWFPWFFLWAANLGGLLLFFRELGFRLVIVPTPARS